MCGIFGIVGSYDEKVAKSALEKLTHRGRDNCGIVQQENLFFAHHRLSIVDSGVVAHQPFKYNNLLLSFNGEIYNFRELKKELQNGFNFKTQSDSEVIITSYLKWGVEFVNHLRGMFAIALMDGDSLYLFRDRLGKKPLFFIDLDSFIFASEIKALTPFLKKHELNKDALLSYLSFLAPTPPHTFFKGIQKLASGEYLCYKNRKVEVKRYFDILESSQRIITNRDEAIYKIENLLNESINLRLDSNLPMASLLSGGIDSATINGYAIRNGVKLQTYTLGYKEFKKYDERSNAKKTADFLGVENREVIISQDDFLNSIDGVLNTLDEPLNDPASVPLYLLFNEIQKDGYKIVLSGEGSDELFLGYRQYFEYLDIEKASTLKHKNWLKNYFKANYSQNREWEHYKRIFNNSLLFRTSGECFTDLQKNNLLKMNVKDNQALKYLQPYRDRYEESSYVDESSWYSYIDLNLFQAEHFLTKLDRVSMAHTIESRTPFLDHKLVELVFSLSPELRYKDGVTKSLLKEVVKPMLNDEILTRKKKGFSNPYMEYLLSSNRLDVIKEVNKQTGMFKTKELSEYLESAKTGGFKQHIWGLYVLSEWIKKWML